MKSNVFFLLLCWWMAFTSCHEDRIVLKGCCDNEPMGGSFGNARVYIPNIFTPNGDGSNDYFLVQGDSIKRIVSLEIRNRKDKLVFQVQDVPEGDSAGAWDGKTGDNIQKGLYDVTAVVEALDGTIITIETKVCNYPCGLMDEEEMISIDGCRFPDEWECWLWDDGCYNIEPSSCFK